MLVDVGTNTDDLDEDARYDEWRKQQEELERQQDQVAVVVVEDSPKPLQCRRRGRKPKGDDQIQRLREVLEQGTADGLRNFSGGVLEEVQDAAGRVKMGETFTNLKDFDYCVDSWCVLNSRACQRWRKQANSRTMICRYGHPVRVRVERQDVREQGGIKRKYIGADRNEDIASVFESRRLRRSVGNAQLTLTDELPRKRIRKTGVTGACGEKARYASAHMEDDIIANDEGNASNDGSGKKGGVEKCKWRVRCTRLKKTGLFQITVCNLRHTCPENVHTWRGPTRRKAWLAQIVGKKQLVGAIENPRIEDKEGSPKELGCPNATPDGVNYLLSIDRNDAQECNGLTVV